MNQEQEHQPSVYDHYGMSHNHYLITHKDLTAEWVRITNPKVTNPFIFKINIMRICGITSNYSTSESKQMFYDHFFILFMKYKVECVQ